MGNEGFQTTNGARLAELRRHGDAILLVSHGLESVKRLCHGVAWLDHGRLKAFGPPHEIVEQYRQASGA